MPFMALKIWSKNLKISRKMRRWRFQNIIPMNLLKRKTMVQFPGKGGWRFSVYKGETIPYI